MTFWNLQVKCFANNKFFYCRSTLMAGKVLRWDECYAEETIELEIFLLWSLPQNANASLTVFCPNRDYPIPIEQISTTRVVGIRFRLFSPQAIFKFMDMCSGLWITKRTCLENGKREFGLNGTLTLIKVSVLMYSSSF